MDDANFLQLFDDLMRRYETSPLFEKLLKLDEYEIITDQNKLPSWWKENNNFILCPKKRAIDGIPSIQLHSGYAKCSNFIIICNEESNYGLLVWGDGGLMYVSRQSNIKGAGVALGSGCIVIGPVVRHTARLNLNCRNGGKIILIKDILIASDVSIQTDDCHTLYNIEDGKRVNPFGGSVVIDEHVWIGEDVNIMGNTTIGKNTVVGARSFVRGNGFPDNAVLAGTPARVLSEGTNWDYRDLPPGIDMRSEASKKTADR
jgi:acetyltransferase-like isoleucine patch superfamily enzyme